METDAILGAVSAYLEEKYRPMAVAVYGSFADGSFGAESDFDALVITDGGGKAHDTSTVAGTELDVFIYPADELRGGYDPEEFLQAADGVILKDTDGVAAALIEDVRRYLAEKPKKTPEELREALVWCRKMAGRAARGDAEGLYRAHWLLTESLEIYMDARGQVYRGPKKALRYMAERDGKSFGIYENALSRFSAETLSAWIDRLEAAAAGYSGEKP